MGRSHLEIRAVEPNNRKRVFVVRTARRTLEFPYARLDPAPTPDDRLARVYVDGELANEGLTWVLESGREGSLHIDSVLEYNEDPAHMARVLLYRLTIEAQDLLETSGLSKREVSRRLSTSPAQLYRLLDQTNYGKSLPQLLALLHVLGYEAKIEITPRQASTA
jgi:hypothetical protein